MTDYGTDFSLGPDEEGIFDLDEFLSVADSATALNQAIARRLTTSGLFYDLGYGRDLRQMLGGNTPVDVIAQIAEAEALQDERVKSCRWDAARNVEDGTIDGPFAITPFDGPTFTLTISVDVATGLIKAEDGG